jgi:hypothetical protein
VRSRRKYIIAESILVLIALIAGIAIVASFHRKSTTKVAAPGSTSSTVGTSPGDASGSGSGSGTGTGTGSGSQGTGGSTGSSGPGGGTQSGSRTTSGVPPTGSVANDTSCTDCGQEPNPGRCSGWTESFTNNSNTDVTGITIDPPAGKYTAPGRTWQTPDPASVTLNLDIKPSTTQKVRFLTCSPTALPASNATFVATAPAKFSWQWITGQRGSACFGAAC